MFSYMKLVKCVIPKYKEHSYWTQTPNYCKCIGNKGKHLLKGVQLVSQIDVNIHSLLEGLTALMNPLPKSNNSIIFTTLELFQIRLHCYDKLTTNIVVTILHIVNLHYFERKKENNGTFVGKQLLLMIFPDTCLYIHMCQAFPFKWIQYVGIRLVVILEEPLVPSPWNNM